jgi:BMFP domain-containing protein YqiC
MQTRHRFFDDISKVAGSAVGTLASMKTEIELLIRQKVEIFISEMNLVTREEFDVVKAMAAKARDEQIKLQKRIDYLELKLSAQKPKSAVKKKTVKKSKAINKKK